MSKSFRQMLKPRALQALRPSRVPQTRCLSSASVRRPQSGENNREPRRPISLLHSRKKSTVSRPQEPQRQPPSRPSQAAATSTEASPSDIEIRINGKAHRFSPILLRDLCECAQCKDPSTNQKYRPTTDIPASISAREVTETGTGVSILWDPDVLGYGRDHRTEIPVETLRQIAEAGVPGIAYDASLKEPRVFWDAEEYGRLSDMSYEEYMQSDEALYGILRQLHTHGLAFLTNVPESEKSVSTIAERIGPVKNTFYGYTWDVRSVPEAKNVAYTSQDLGFHMDLLYMEQPPHLQFLHCIRSSSVGGASLFTDSFRSASDLLDSDLDAWTQLMSHPVNFHYNHPSSALYHQRRRVFEFRQGVYLGGKRKMLAGYQAKSAYALLKNRHPLGGTADFSPMDLIEAVSWSPPFQGPFGRTTLPPFSTPPTQALASKHLRLWHAAAQKFDALIHRPEMVYERLMKPGQCVLFDNRRVLHARKAFEVGDLGKERWLRGAYLDKDPYLSKLRVLRHRLGKAGEKDSGDNFEAAAGVA